MRVPLIRRLVAVFSVLALLLTGFAATEVAANAVPCGMDMPAAAASGTPCDDHGVPDGPEKAPGAAVCFAKCSVPPLDQVAGPSALARTERLAAQTPRRYSAQAGIGIVPPLQPPRA